MSFCQRLKKETTLRCCIKVCPKMRNKVLKSMKKVELGCIGVGMLQVKLQLPCILELFKDTSYLMVAKTVLLQLLMFMEESGRLYKESKSGLVNLDQMQIIKALILVITNVHINVFHKKSVSGMKMEMKMLELGRVWFTM